MKRVRLALVGILILTGVVCSSARAAQPAPKNAAVAPSGAASSSAADAGANDGTGAQTGTVTTVPRTVIGPAQEREVVWLCFAGVILSLLWTVIAWSRARATQRAREADTDPDPMMMVGSRNGAPPHKSVRLRQLFMSNLWRVKGSLVLAAFFTAGGAAVELLKPWPLKLMIDHSVLGKQLPHALGWLRSVAPDPFSVLVVAAIAIVIISVLGGIFSYSETFITKALGYKILYSLRREVFSHLQRLSLSFHNRARSGDLLTTFAKDTSTLKDVFAGDLLKFADEALSMIGMLWIMWWVNWRMCLIALGSLPFLCFMLFHLYRQTKLSMRKQRKQDGRVTSRLNEVLAAMPLVQAYGREKHEEERYNHVSDQTLRESIRMSRLEAAAGRTSQLMSAVGTAAAALFGGMEVLQGRMMPGELVLLMTYVSNIYKPIRNLAKMSIDFSKVSASA